MSGHIPALKNRPAAVSRLRRFVLRLSTLRQRDKLVAVALLDALHMRLWRCAIGQQTLAARLNCSVRTVARALKALREAGILRWRRRRRRSSEYSLNVRLVDDSVTAPDGVDRPYRAPGAPLITATRPERLTAVAAADVAAALVAERRPMPMLSRSILKTCGVVS